ncbi:MAG TPA: hypothetical protein DF610_19035 [Sphingobacterium sp.]|nr:hypothetical protein [Sphingobacterium sp.]
MMKSNPMIIRKANQGISAQRDKILKHNFYHDDGIYFGFFNLQRYDRKKAGDHVLSAATSRSFGINDH